MALVQTAFIWVAYAVAVCLVALIAAVFTYVYQTPRDRSALVSTVTIIALTSLLATVLLMPVDIALVSSTTSSKNGVRKDWATPEAIHNIVYTLKIVYYTLYSLDALLCLLVIPFTYFLYEEYDDVDAEEGGQTIGQRLLGAAKYTLIFVVLVVILFLVGFFVPVARNRGDAHLDLDYFRHLLYENHGVRALTFALGLLISLGTLLYILYTATGFAILPISFIKSAPSISAPQLSETTASALEQNRERQRQLEGRNAGRQEGMSTKDQRELEALVREERTLVRRERLAAEAQGEGRSWIVKAWTKFCAVFRPLKLIGGLLLLLISLILWVSMLITGIDKAANSICKQHCGYILEKYVIKTYAFEQLLTYPSITIFQPINHILVLSAKVFPIDYIIMLFLVLYFFSSSVAGLAAIGIRFLWIPLFNIRNHHTSPQALLMATVMLTLMMLAINYSIAMIVAPQYATFGPQTYCDRPARHPTEQPDCSRNRHLIRPCTLDAGRGICTPSVVSTFLNRVTLNFPVFGALMFWAQFFFLGTFLIVFTTSLFKTPRLNLDELDEAAEAEEEEGLLASTGRRFGATWQDITGRISNKGNGGSGSGQQAQ